MLHTETRRALTTWCLGASLTVLATGCTTLGLTPEASVTTGTVAAPEVAAWTLAALCREHHPGIDSWPGTSRSPVPIVRTEDGTFVLALGGPSDGAVRVATDGRLDPPRARLDPEAGARLEPGEFIAAESRTTHGGPLRLEIRITPGDGGGAVVELYIPEEAGYRDLADRMTLALELLDAIHRSNALLAAGRTDEASRSAERAVAAIRIRAVTGLGELEAWLHASRSIALRRGGDLLGARSAMCSAVSLRPTCAELRATLAELDQRLARSSDARRTLELLAAGIGDPDQARTATATLAAMAVASRWAAPAELAAATSARLLSDGDTAGALSWAHSARALGGDDTREGRLDAHARVRGDLRSALAIGLARLGRVGFDADLVLSTCDDALAAGDTPAALRILARHWRGLSGSRREAAAIMLHRACAIAGPAMSSRVLSSARNSELLRTTLPDWSRQSTDSHVGPSLLARMPKLRADHRQGRLEARESDDWEFAPGVAPLR